MIFTDDKILFIKQKALSLGFGDLGIASAGFLKKEHENLLLWLQNGFGANMEYMERDTDKRTDPRILFEECRSVIIVILNYRQKNYKSYISEYGCGEDYHVILKNKLKILNDEIAGIAGKDYKSKTFTDSSPVMEKPWAVNAGLGWQGRHTIVINPEFGTKFYIGGILTNVELKKEINIRVEYGCTDCRLCIDSCPTGALSFPGILDAKKCIAYQTIENKGDIPAEVASEIKESIYGCDICQNVCPWNTKNNNFSSIIKTLAHTVISPEEWLEMSDENFNTMCSNTVISRRGLNKIKNNALIVLKNKK